VTYRDGHGAVGGQSGSSEAVGLSIRMIRIVEQRLSPGWTLVSGRLRCEETRQCGSTMSKGPPPARGLPGARSSHRVQVGEDAQVPPRPMYSCKKPENRGGSFDALETVAAVLVERPWAGSS